MRLYNFHDTLNAFVKYVFSEQYRIEFEKRQQRIDDAVLTKRIDLLHKYDRIQRNDADYWKLDLMD